MSEPEESDELDVKFADEADPVFWGVEVDFSFDRSLNTDRKSLFYSARKVVLDENYVQIQLPNGKYQCFPIHQVRKVLAMRATVSTGYTGEDFSPDELY